MTALFIGPDVLQQIHELRDFAFAQPVDMAILTAKISTPDGKSAHMNQMTRQTIRVPIDFLVTFSVETGHPCGTCRHMSMSVQRDGRIPNEHAIWMVAKEFGFTKSLSECMIWKEQLAGHGIAINIVQPV